MGEGTRRGPTFRIIAAAALVLPGPACSEPGSGGPRNVVVDSVGTKIISYDLGGVEIPVAWTVGPHDLEIGRHDGPAEYTLSHVVGLASTSDGSFSTSFRIASQPSGRWWS